MFYEILGACSKKNARAETGILQFAVTKVFLLTLYGKLCSRRFDLSVWLETLERTKVWIGNLKITIRCGELNQIPDCEIPLDLAVGRERRVTILFPASKGGFIAHRQSWEGIGATPSLCVAQQQAKGL